MKARDPFSGSASVTYTGTNSLSITSDTGAVKWCVIEQSTASSVPTAPLFNDACFQAPKPTSIALGALGSRIVYVYTLDVAQNLSATYGSATINYLLNQDPTANPDAFTLLVNSTASSLNVLKNDTDPEGSPLTINSKTDGAHGTVTIHSSGKHLIYILTNPSYVGSDSFTYSVQDPYGGTSPPASVSIDVQALSNWLNRKPITLSGTISPSASQINFPVLVEIASDANIAAKAQNSGADLVFVSTDQITPLKHEIESYDFTTGKLIAWVLIPSLSANTDFNFYIHYGNATSGEMESPMDVWGDNYVGVWHFNEDPSITNSGYCAGENANECDSSPYHRNGKSNGSMTSTDLISGKIGGALDFDGSNDYINYPCTGCPGYPYSLSLWFSARNLSGNLLSYDAGAAKSLAMTGGTYLHAGTGTYNRGIDLSLLSINTWFHIVAVYTNSTDIKTYLNGVDQTVPTNNWWNSFGNSMGRRETGSALQYNGQIDEVKIYNGILAPETIASRYAAENNPSSFLTIGPEE
ncbi:MAG: DUF2341 domain-containing protein [Bdellovibrionales bacterium]|nr:DUF2341 domain-containing protein [Bdellovibrionales bacterium]